MSAIVVLVVTGCASDGSGASRSADPAPDTTRPGSREATVDADRVPNPTVTPARGGRGEPTGGLRYDVADFGYQENEFLFGGRAKTYPPLDLPRARYRSRMIVWTPTDPSDFNGTTVVEWAEVSDAGEFELTVEVHAQSSMLIEDGYAFVLVSAEPRGVCNPVPSACPSTSLRGADPGRYGTLRHPGDAYSFDIFNQALQAIRFPTRVAPLGELDTRYVIAEGFQRSIDKYFPQGTPDPPPSTTPLGIHGPLNAYLASGADDDARLADAFLIDGAAPATEPSDYRVPTLHHLDESAIRSAPTPDRPNHVTWEVVGAPHADRWAGDHVELPSSDEPEPKLSRDEELARRDRFADYGLAPGLSGAVCSPGPETGSLFPRRFTLTAALAALHQWLETGDPAPAAPRAERASPVPDDPTGTLLRDPDGNAIGGLRSPIIDVPVAAYHGEACISAGTTTPLSPERLAELYPTHQHYVEELRAATDTAVAGGLLLCGDAETVLREASASDIGGHDPFTAAPACA